MEFIEQKMTHPLEINAQNIHIGGTVATGSSNRLIDGSNRPSRNMEQKFKQWWNLSLYNAGMGLNYGGLYTQLVAPANDAIAYTNNQSFTCSAEVGGGAYLTNIFFVG